MIVFDNVAYSYGGAELLSEVNLRLAPGSFHFLTGPSGAGKSTLLKLCYAELLPTAGRVTLFDRDVRSLSRDEVARMQRQMVQKLAVLMHDANAAAGQGDVIARQAAHLAVKQRQPPGGGQQFGVTQFQESRLARP